MVQRRFHVRGGRLLTYGLVAFSLVAAAIGSQPAAASGGGSTRQVSRAGTASFPAGSGSSSTLGIQSNETPATGADGGAPNRSSSGAGSTTSVGAITQPHSLTTSSSGLQVSFAGLNHFDNRFGTTSGANQF